MATNAQFLAAIQALSVTGVTRHYDEPPASVDTADLPALFPMPPGSGLGGLAVSCLTANKTRSIQIIILIEPVGQGTPSQNYGKIAALMDNLETALDAMTVVNFVDYDINADGNFPGGNTTYWAIVANVTARDL